MAGRLKSGYVYLLGNECMRGIYKIGSTERSPYTRAEQLSQNTATPWPFHVISFVKVDDRFDAEWLIHQQLSDFRVNERREFFAFHRDSLPWLLSVFANFPGGESVWFDDQQWSLAELQSKSPWAYDEEAAGFHLAMPAQAPLHVSEAAELG